MESAEPGVESIEWESPETPPNADDYIFVEGKRMVRPYFFEFIAHVKRRWAGKTIVDLFTNEFRQRPREYYIHAVECGRIQVGGKRVGTTYVVRDSEKVSHFVHRHEPPVAPEPVRVLEEGPDVITVYKPSSVPVHPCGQYRKNTVVGILEAEHRTGPLFPIHRLDRLVSGLLILARNAQTADKFRQEIEAGRVHKQYVAKVKGVFPAHEVEVNAAVFYDAREGVSRVETSPSSGDITGKEACTRFQRLSTDGVFSIVRCAPVTGRTHQIRVHLQHLGHPIGNDALYLQANPPKRSKEGVNADTAAKAAISHPENLGTAGDRDVTAASRATIEGMGHMQRVDSCPKPAVVSGHSCKKTALCCEKSREAAEIEDQNSRRTTSSCFTQTGFVTDRVPSEQADCAQESEESAAATKADCHGSNVNSPPEMGSDYTEGRTSQEFVLDVKCTHCPNLGPSGFREVEEGLWLHCVRYACSAWTYECPLPNWAL